ncbi:oxidoreductase HTATIP2 isoform X2 [Brachionus plicatilis]|uniref:Protein HTATIP2 n=1 Tax=Brachionus plicatilis TaxID=10195 RepID=A0A3M7SGB2_BRAPC|nr:oxidoreductase HTATIP2 isoform X2 [Brachionus plicatilis]
MNPNFVKIEPKSLSVAIVGFTGECGKALAKEILSNDLFSRTLLIGRRKVDFDQEFYKKGEQTIVDFDKLEEYEEVFKNVDVIYCCLGTTRAKAGVDGFRKVDFDYVNNTATVAAKNGCKQFHLVSSSGANKNSSLLYPQVKGLAEEAVNKHGFDKTFIYRPKLLIGTDREESRVGESIFRALTKPFQYIAPTLLTTPIDTLAKAMLTNTFLNNKLSDDKNQLIENSMIFEASEIYEKFIKSDK